jgi:hypothetical protein
MVNNTYKHLYPQIIEHKKDIVKWLLEIQAPAWDSHTNMVVF